MRIFCDSPGTHIWRGAGHGIDFRSLWRPGLDQRRCPVTNRCPASHAASRGGAPFQKHEPFQRENERLRRRGPDKKGSLREVEMWRGGVGLANLFPAHSSAVPREPDRARFPHPARRTEQCYSCIRLLDEILRFRPEMPCQAHIGVKGPTKFLRNPI